MVTEEKAARHPRMWALGAAVVICALWGVDSLRDYRGGTAPCGTTIWLVVLPTPLGFCGEREADGCSGWCVACVLTCFSMVFPRGTVCASWRCWCCPGPRLFWRPLMWAGRRKRIQCAC